MGQRRRVGAGSLGRFAGSTAAAASSAVLAPARALLLALAFALLHHQGVSAAAPKSHADCAGLVPQEELRRGKGAFLSGCETLSSTNLGGCWTQPDNDETVGCQTCIVQEDVFAGAVWPVVFPDELDPCPMAMNYESFYEAQYGPLSVVTAASLTSPDCPEGWLYFQDTGHCYFKSHNDAKSANQADAVSQCEASGAWVIAIESQAENDFLLRNLLFTGFFGETYTGLSKASPDAQWMWPSDSSVETYNCMKDYSNWLEGPAAGCAASFDSGTDGSCMEIYPYEPKKWNPFSCIVGKHFVCEMPARGSAGGAPNSTQTPATSGTPTPAVPVTTKPAAVPTPSPPSPPPTAPSIPTSAPAVPTGAPVVDPTPAPVPATSPPTMAPVDPTAAPATGLLWSGDKILSVTKRLVWTDASYSLYLKEGDVETAVATKITKVVLGTQTDVYSVKDGCYRLEVASSGDPSRLTWSVTGGDPFRGLSPTTGHGLDGGLFSVGGGVCDASECEAQCLADTFRAGGGRSGTCAGYSVLLSGACGGDACPGDAEVDLEQKCVQAGCGATVCGLNIKGGDSVDVKYVVDMKALVEKPATAASAASSSAYGSTAAAEFEAAVARWLGVDPSEVSVTAVDGVRVQAEEGDTSSRRRRGLGGVDLIGRRGKATARRGLQTDPAPETSYTRYEARVNTANMTEANATDLQGAAASAGSAGELQTRLREGGGIWGDASVSSVEGTVVQEYSVVESGDPGAGPEGAASGEVGGGGAFENPLVIGGISAAAVVAVALLVTLCCSRRKKSARRTRSKRASGSGKTALTQDFEGGEGGQRFRASDVTSQEEHLRISFVGESPFAAASAAPAAPAAAPAAEPSGSRRANRGGGALSPSPDRDTGAGERSAEIPAILSLESGHRERVGSGGGGGNSDASSTANLSNELIPGESATDFFSAKPPQVDNNNGRKNNKKNTVRKLFGANASRKVEDTKADSKQPRIRGPSGALASLNFARGFSVDDLDDYDDDASTSSGTACGAGAGTVSYAPSDFGSAAGSRYTPESSLGEQRESFAFATQQSAAAAARIRDLHERQNKKTKAVKLSNVGSSAPSPMPVSPDTDEVLAMSIAPTPAHDRQFNARVGRTREDLRDDEEQQESRQRTGGGSAAPIDRARRTPRRQSRSSSRPRSSEKEQDREPSESGRSERGGRKGSKGQEREPQRGR